MDIIALSLKTKRLAVWLDASSRPASLLRRQFHGAPFGGCYVTLDPERQGPVASVNTNRVYLCGTEPRMQPDSVARLIDLFVAEGVKRFFVWLSPGPDMDVVRGWLEASGSLASPGPVTRPCAASGIRNSGSKPSLRSGR